MTILYMSGTAEPPARSAGETIEESRVRVMCPVTVALKAWKGVLDSAKAGEITSAELDAWKAEFGA